jgi:predicted HD phosphohydrolase
MPKRGGASETETLAQSVVRYTRLDEATAEDFEALKKVSRPFRATHADRVLGYFTTLRDSYSGEKVDRYTHSLQTATMALRDQASEEVVVAALLHDIGDLLAQDNHAAFAAAVLQPYVSERTHWIVLHHHEFQGYYWWHHYGRDRFAREKYRGHPHFEATIEFCENWDQRALDPNYGTLELGVFEPMVRRVFARTPWERSTAPS